MNSEIIDALTEGIAERAHELTEETIREIRLARYRELSDVPNTMTLSNPVIQHAMKSRGE